MRQAVYRVWAVAILAVFGFGLWATAGDSAVDKYPEREVNIVVPFPAGGGMDLPARIYQKYFEKYLGKCIVTNQPGAAGTIAASEFKDAIAPDGYKIMCVNTALPIPYALKTIDYTYEDFEVICSFVDQAIGIVVRADSPYYSLTDLVEAAKKNPGKLNVGASFNNNQQYSVLELEVKGGCRFNVVEVGGVILKAPELMAGRVVAYSDAVSAFSQYVESGEFRCIGIFMPERIDMMPDIATSREQGYDITCDFAFGFWAPKGTPRGIIEKISQATEKICKDPGYVKDLLAIKCVPAYMGPEDFKAYYKMVHDKLLKLTDDLLKAQ